MDVTAAWHVASAYVNQHISVILFAVTTATFLGATVYFNPGYLTLGGLPDEVSVLFNPTSTFDLVNDTQFVTIFNLVNITQLASKFLPASVNSFANEILSSTTQYKLTNATNLSNSAYLITQAAATQAQELANTHQPNSVWKSFGARYSFATIYEVVLETIRTYDLVWAALPHSILPFAWLGMYVLTTWHIWKIGAKVVSVGYTFLKRRYQNIRSQSSVDGAALPSLSQSPSLSSVLSSSVTLPPLPDSPTLHHEEQKSQSIQTTLSDPFGSSANRNSALSSIVSGGETSPVDLVPSMKRNHVTFSGILPGVSIAPKDLKPRPVHSVWAKFRNEGVKSIQATRTSSEILPKKIEDNAGPRNSPSDNLSTIQDREHARKEFERTFPNGYLKIDTPGRGLLCGLYAIIKTIEAMFPDTKPPKLEELQEVNRKIIQSIPHLRNVTNNFSVDHLQLILGAWAENSWKALRIGYIRTDEYGVERSNVISLPDDDYLAWIVWIHYEGSGDSGHYSGVRPRPSATEPEEIPVKNEKSTPEAQGENSTSNINIAGEAGSNNVRVTSLSSRAPRSRTDAAQALPVFNTSSPSIYDETKFRPSTAIQPADFEKVPAWTGGHAPGEIRLRRERYRSYPARPTQTQIVRAEDGSRTHSASFIPATTEFQFERPMPLSMTQQSKDGNENKDEDNDKNGDGDGDEAISPKTTLPEKQN